MKRPGVKATVQIAVSAGLIAILLWLAAKNHVWHQIASVPAWAIVTAAALMLVSWAINSVRWGLLLRVAGIREHPATLLCLYLIGMFCTLLLPTGAGGDAVRIWDVARRRGHAAVVIVATLQERLIGMATAMAVGLVAVGIHWQDLPPRMRPFLLLVPLAAIVAVAVLIYPRIPLAIAARLWRPWQDTRVVQKIAAALQPATQVPPLTPLRLAPVLVVTLISALLSFGVYRVLGAGVAVGVPFSGYCLVVPLVWVIAMTPSVGGAGVREGGFVLLMGTLFNVSKDKSIAVAALFFIIQTAMACIGGLLLVRRAPTWKVTHTESAPAPLARN